MEQAKVQNKLYRRVTKFTLIFLGLVIVYELFGFFALPPLLKSILQKKSPELINRSLSIERIKYDPFLLRLELNNLALTGSQDEPFVAFERFFIDVQLVSIFKKALIVKSLEVDAPRISIRRNQDNSFNFSDILEKSSDEPEQQPAEKSGAFHFSFNNIRLTQGRITFDDQPEQTTHKIEELHLALPSISNLDYAQESYIKPAFSARINDSLFELDGRSKPFAPDRESRIDIHLANLDLLHYLAYLPDDLQLTLQSGLLDIDSAVIFAMRENTPYLALEGTVGLKNATISDRNGTDYVSLPKVLVDISPSDLLKSEIRLAGVQVDKPQFILTRTVDNELLPLALLPQSTSDTPAGEQPESAGSSANIRIASITVNEAVIDLTDKAAHGFTSRLSPINIEVTDFSTLENEQTRYNLSIATEMQERIAAEGSLSLIPLHSQGHLALENLQPSKYTPYYGDYLNGSIRDEGRLSLQTDYQYGAEPQKMRLEEMATDIQNFVLADSDGQALVDLPGIHQQSGTFDLIESRLQLGSIKIEGGHILLKRDKKGGINLAQLARTPTAQKPEKESPESSQPAADEQSQSFVAELGSLELQTMNIDFEDHTPASTGKAALVIDKLAVKDFSTSPGAKATYSAAIGVNKTGTVDLDGTFVLDPLQASARVRAKAIGLDMLQPYIDDVATLTLTNGAVNASAELEFSLPDPSQKPAITVQADASVDNLSTLDNLGEDLLNWKSLGLQQATYSSVNNSFSLEKVKLEDLFTNIVVEENGSLNLLSLRKQDDSQAAEEAASAAEQIESPPEERLQITLPTFAMDNGTVQFSDKKVTPNYSGELSDINGTISGLSSEPGTRADLDLDATFNGQAPLSIHGKINPLAERFFADIGVNFKNIEMSPVTPYSMRHIGYKLSKGKLNLDLHYLIDGKEIKAENEAMLDQLTLGESVDSPDKLDLPIQLAMALLKNRRGEITLNVPVQGNLGDPEFSIGGVIFKVIFNLIAKAATSPFSLLGALIPDMEDIDVINFPPGSVMIDDKAQKKLDGLAKAFFERPGLKMDITPESATEADRRQILDDKMNRLLLLEKVKAGAPEKALEEREGSMEILPEEYPVYLYAAYKNLNRNNKPAVPEASQDQTPAAEEIELPDPLSVEGEARIVVIDKMEAALKESLEVSNDELRQLAIDRAAAVNEYLVKAGPVEPERLFVIEPDNIEMKDTDEAQIKLTIK